MVLERVRSTLYVTRRTRDVKRGVGNPSYGTHRAPPSFLVAASSEEGVVLLPGGWPAVALRVAA